MRHALLVGLGLVIGGCSSAGNETGAGSQDLTSLEISIAGDGDTLSLNDGYTCGERFEIEGRVRLTCTRGDAKREIFAGDRQALLIERPSSHSDHKSYFACTGNGSRSDRLPASLSCQSTPLRDRPSHGGGLVSPFDSTVDGFDVPNAHAVGSSGKLFRSMAPGLPGDFDQLFAADIGAVLIFKNATGNGHDVSDEVDTLKARGMASSQIANIPFKWKELDGFKAPCEQVVEGLKFLRTNLGAGKKTLFHCTVGEDRTGFLAAMEQVVEGGMDPNTAWDGEMCEHGYGAGNPLKPSVVTNALETSLKPLYRKMAYLAAKGSLANLDASVCATDPETASDFAAKAPKLERLTCGTSTLFEP